MIDKNVAIILKAMWYQLRLILKLLSMLVNFIYRRGGLKAVLAVTGSLVGILVVIGIAVAVSSVAAPPTGPNSPKVVSPPPSNPPSPSSGEDSKTRQGVGSSKGSEQTMVMSASPSSSPSPSSSSEEKLRAAVRDYYAAVDRQDWNYAYDNNDSQTKRKYTKDEYVQKNRYLADVDPLAQSSPVVTSGISTSSPVEVTLNQTFESGVTRSRVTYFVQENGAWKHRFSQEDDAVFLPDASYDEFVRAKQSGA